MAGKNPKIIMTTAEKQVLEHPATLRLFVCILVPALAGFSVYVAITGRVPASIVLCVLLSGFTAVMGVMKSPLPETKKILAYRHILRVMLLVFGFYLLLMVGVYGQNEVSFWCFLFVFLVSLWMPERIGTGSVLVFNAGIVITGFVPDPSRFFDNSELLSRFYVALFVFSLLAMGASRVRHRYLDSLFRVRAGLEESEKKYQALSRKLIREIRQRDKIEKRLHHAIKMETLGTVAAGVAHDLNNILSGLVTYPELLLLDLEADHPMREPLETIRSSGARAAVIVDDLLALSRRGVALSEPVDLCRIVGEYLASPEHRQLMAGCEAVRLSTTYDAVSAVVEGSATHLSKTLMNLVSNAVESVAGPGTVHIEVAVVTLEEPDSLAVPVQGEKEIPPGHYVRLTVSDTGEGIAPEAQEQVFEPFYTRKKMGRSGTGLGMALVLGTVNDHGGYIRLVSAPGEGTAISIYFPAAAADANPAAPGNGVDRLKGNGASVLVVDDEPVQRKIAEGLLRRLGYRVLTCSSGEAAIALLEKQPVDLVILDIIMEPGMNGVEACEAMLEADPGQKVLFVTGYSDSETLDRAGRLSRGDCLFKPYGLEKMGAMVKERLGI
jgi:signal transduction histidine kinase